MILQQVILPTSDSAKRRRARERERGEEKKNHSLSHDDAFVYKSQYISYGTNFNLKTYYIWKKTKTSYTAGDCDPGRLPKIKL